MLLSDKYWDYIDTPARAEFLEGSTASGKTTTVAVKFIMNVAESDMKLHVIAGNTTGVIEKNIINADMGLLQIFPNLEYCGNGDKENKLPHIKFKTGSSTKIIYVLGYDNASKWKNALGSQFGCVWVDECNTANIDFMGFNWSQWQVEQLKAMEKYKAQNKKKFTKSFSNINDSIDAMIFAARQEGGTEQEQKILRALKKGLKASKVSQGAEGAFFKLNTRKLEALIKATKNDFGTAEKAMLRMSEDKYRQIIFNAQVYANTGAGTYEKAVDMATKDFLKAGINCIEYANGARHTAKDYAKMAIQTASKRAYLTGEGEMRQSWGISTVIMNKRANACPKCLPFVGKVLIDDVWSGGKASDGPYPLMSSAMAAGLYHPNCKDVHTTYFPELDDEPDSKFSKKELEQVKEGYRQDQKQQYAGRMMEQYGRLSEFSLDPDNKKMYTDKKEQWEIQAESLRSDSDYQDTIKQRREEWKKKHSEFDKVTAKTEINNIKSQIEDMQKQINASLKKEKPLEKKVYIDGTGTDEDMRILRQSATERKKLQEHVEVLNNNMLDKQEVYKNEAQNRILKAGTVEEIKLSKKMTPDTVDALEDALTKLKNKYGIMPKGVVYNPSKVPDATVTYNWLDDNIYISNRFNDINNYADVVKKSEDSLIEYREKSGIVKIQKERLKNAEKILSDKNIKGYKREKAVINKAEAEIELNTQRMAVRENLMDTLTHEYGHFIHRHANADYVQKSSVFGAKDLGGKLINGDWKYDINSHYSANAKIEAAKISKYATESPYEAFAEGFLAKEKGQKIPGGIEKVIEEAKVKAGVKNVAKVGKSGTIKQNLQLFANKMPDEKFTQYSLNPLKAPDKAKAFKSALGYTVDNFEDLRQNILDNIVEDNFIEKGDNGYGMRYEQILELTGPNGKKAKVLTAWIQDGDDKRLVSVYVDK